MRFDPRVTLQKPPNESSTTGHAIVLYGICEIGNETFYMLRDPGPEGYGATRLVSYNALCTQYLFHEYNKAGDYRLDQTGVWIHTIVKESAHTENEIGVDI